jgi:tellurite methyltransferase
VTREDRQRWDARWAGPGITREVSPLLLRYAAHLTGGDALDLACGVGQNALWLAGRGYCVTGVDISPVALKQARAGAEARGLAGLATFVEADLDSYPIPESAFDVVAVFRFLNRDLLPAIQAALRPGGWLFYQTFNLRRLESHPDLEPAYLLEPGELERALAGLDIVESEERGEVSQVVCRRR